MRQGYSKVFKMWYWIQSDHENISWSGCNKRYSSEIHLKTKFSPHDIRPEQHFVKSQHPNVNSNFHLLIIQCRMNTIIGIRNSKYWFCTYDSENSVIDVQLDDEPLLYLIMTFQLDRYRNKLSLNPKQNKNPKKCIPRTTAKTTYMGMGSTGEHDQN